MSTHEIITTTARLPVYFDIYETYNQLVPSHWHSHLEILYIFKGTMNIVRNDVKYTIYENDLFVVNSGDIHLTRSPGNIEVLLLQIPYELLSHSMPEYKSIRFKEYFPHSELNKEPAYQKMIQYLLTMSRLYKQGGEGYQFFFTSNLYLFLHILYHQYATQQDPLNNNKASRHLSRVKKVIDYVEQNYMEQISLIDAASLVNLNPEYFCRFFKKYTGFTLIEYIHLVRITHIHADILDTDDSITSIQERHGFTNYRVFNRIFKETYGCTPSKLRSASTPGMDATPGTH